METLQGVPLWKRPYGRLTTIDRNTAEHGWMVPMGDLDHRRLKPLGLGPVGPPTRGHTLLTKTLMIVGQEGTTQRAEGGAAAGAQLYDPGCSRGPSFDLSGVRASEWAALVMELVPGETFDTIIHARGIGPARAPTIARQICDALEAAHEKGIVHRDLKPVVRRRYRAR